MAHDSFGLSRRELERELNWMLRRPVSSDPNAMLKALGQIVITLIEKNNAAIAATLAKREAWDAGEDF